MSFLTGLFDAGKGSGYQAQGATMGQANQAYNQAEQGLGQQQQFVNALAGQNGLQNQSNVYAQQQALANQLGGMAQGTGPNPAQSQLAQATGANTANQAALMAGQRGASANPALIARQAAMQGAQNQQNAAGQAATLGAQQQLGAIGALQNQQQGLGNLATQQVGQQAQGLQNLNQLTQTEQNQLLGSIGNQNAANSSIAAQNAKSQNQLGGGLMSGLSSALTLLNQGGQVGYADGGQVKDSGPQSAFGKMMKAGVAGMQAPMAAQDNSVTAEGQAIGQNLVKGAQALGTGISNLLGGGSTPALPEGMPSSQDWANAMGAPSAKMAKGGKVPVLLSPGEKTLSNNEAKKVADGKASVHKVGQKVPGKAKVKGDSEVNDTVPKKMNAGDMVIPKSVMESPNAEGHAARFVQAHMSSLSKKKAK